MTAPCLALNNAAAQFVTPARILDDSKVHEPQEAKVHVRLLAPAPARGSKSGWSMSIQIGENRFYHLDTLSNTTLDLGQIERGWNTFRFYEVKTITINTKGKHVQSNKIDRSCSGDFVAMSDGDMQIVIDTDAHRLVCRLH
ncbi:MAG: hypothetical protein ACXWJK_01865 [Burkholderiaceae bacterium]